MKKVLLFVLISASVISCQKSSLSLVKNTWAGHYTRDSVVASSIDSAKMQEFDCDGDTKWDADTVLSYNNGEPEAIPTTWREVQHGLMVWVEDPKEIAPGVYQRLYFIYDYKKPN